MGRDIAAVGLLALGMGLGLALATFSVLDGQLIARGLPPASNLVGPMGHRAAAAVYGVLGFAAMVLPIAFCAASVKLFRNVGLRITLVSAIAYGLLTVALAGLAHLFLAAQRLASFPAGGLVGAFFEQRAEALFSTVGAGLILGASAVVTLIVATDWKVQRAARSVATGVGAVLRFLSARFAAALDRHRQAVAELRAEEALERASREDDETEAVVEADGAADEAEGRAMARALAVEAAHRTPINDDDDPAWAMEPFALAPIEEPESGDVERPRCKSRIAARLAAESEPRTGAIDDEGKTDSEPEVALSAPPPTVEPEIVLSQAMQERGGKKKKRSAPAFAFTQASDVFRLPGLDLLDAHEVVQKDVDAGGLQKIAEVIVATLKQHGVEGVIRHIRPGPVVTLYEFIPAAGVKLARIENLDKELTLALSAMRIRIIAPIPGKGVVGIEVPNRDRITVFLRGVLESEAFARAGGFLPLALGKNIEGVSTCVDLQRMPHLLVAGTTGAGKSVGLNVMILSLLYRQTPDQVRMIMVDPKMTELSIYDDIPHLLLPVVTDPQKAARALQWAVDEMERRTQMLADTGSKDLKSYNSKIEKLWSGSAAEADIPRPPKRLLVVDVTEGETEDEARARVEAQAAQGDPEAAAAPYEDPTEPPPLPAKGAAAGEEASSDVSPPRKLPYIVVVIDELADLMMTAPREVEISLARLAQKARATGIHLIVATQRPSTDVVTGMVKNNFPARITFRLASRHDSTTIINGSGAESLLGDGDMLVLTATAPLTRVQGAFVSEEEIARVVAFLKEQGRPVYDASILKSREEVGDYGRDEDEDDPVYDQALELVARMEEVSVSKLQREMRLGYNKAAKIVERMEREGIVGPANGVKPRQVLIRPVGEMSSIPNV